MKTHRRFLPLIALGAGIAVVLALAWLISDDSLSPASVAGALANGSSQRSVPDRREARAGQAVDSVSAPRPPATGMIAAPAGVDPFAPALSDAELLRTERRMFQAQTWEVDLAKALDLPPGERLERRAGLFRLAGGGGLVRLDRVYRLGGARVANTATPAASAPASTLAAAADPTGPLDAGGGELVWANAMVADHLMVQVESGVTRERLAAALPHQAKVGRQITGGGLYLVEVPTEGERSVERAVLALNQIKGVVKFAEPDFVLTSADTTANDPLFTANAADLTKQWHLAKIRAPRAWDVLTGPPFPPAHPQYQPRLDQTVVAVVDTGIDYTHPDLMSRMWTNIGETGGGKETNNTDDDGNGKIDDWRGYDFIDNDNDPMDDVGHGTHVAGIIGAVGNNATGGSGVCWNVKLLNLRIIKAQGSGTYGTYSVAIAALDYIRVLNTTGRKVAVANHSWGGNGYSTAMLNAINNPLPSSDPLPGGLSSTYTIGVNTLTVAGNSAEIAKIKLGMSIGGAGIPGGTLVTIISGSTITLSDDTTMAGTSAALTFSNPIRAKPYGVVHVAAAGNSRFNSDRIPVYPACLPSGFVVSVGATDSTDAEALWTGGAGSNYGRLNVDLFAPGSGIWSTKWKAPGDAAYGYESRNGTSMAAPQAAAALALVRMWQPNLTELQARQVLIEQVDQIATLQGKCVGGGRLNIAKIIDRLYQPILVGSGGGTSGGTSLADTALSASLGLTGQVAVSHGSYDVHVLTINQGSVWAWGYAYGGQLGGTYSAGSGEFREQASYRPVKVPGMDDCKMVAARDNRSWALKNDGTVWMWGGGNGTGGNNNTPAPIPGLTDVAWIASEWAVKTDGTVWNFTNPQTAPTQVPVLTDIVMVADGDSHRLALKLDGTVWAWGSQSQGKLGNGQTSGPQITTPIMVSGLPSNIRYVAAGGSDSYAITGDGTVYYWGQPPTTSQALAPTLLPKLQGIACISAGTYSIVAVTIDGNVLTWGRGYTGQLGSGSDTNADPLGSSPSLVQMPGDAGAALFCSTGGFIGGTIAIITEHDTVYCWGDNTHGTLGQGEGQVRSLPTQIAPPGSFVDLFTGDLSGFALDSQFNLYGWGLSSGLGVNSPSDLYGQSPTLLPTYPHFVKVDTAFVHRIGLTPDGKVWTWGSNAYGQLGRSASPTSPPGIVPGLGTAVDVSAAGESEGFSLAALSDGNVWAWGSNSAGQLGDGTTMNRTTPVQVVGLSGVTKVYAGAQGAPDYSYSLAIKSDGTVWSWGNNNYGQLGNGTTTSSTIPVQVIGLTDVIQVTGGATCFALKSDGTVWAWGAGYAAVQQVIGLPSIVRMAADINALLIGSDGRIWVLRSGIGPTEGSGPFPKPVVGLSNVIRVENTSGCCHALRADGSLWVWGQGFSGVGSLGDGFAWSNLPLSVVGLGGISTTLSTLGTGNLSDSWMLQNFSTADLLVDATVADNADPDGDGIPNLLEYALGLDPRTRTSSGLPTQRMDFVGAASQSESAGQVQLFSLPTVDLTSGKHYMALTVERHGDIRQDIDYLVEVSADLQNWMSGDPFTITVLDTAETLEVYDATAIEDAPKRFMRLRIKRK